MSEAELLAELSSLGITLKVEGERLRLNAPKGVLTLELQAQIAAHKTSLMQLLRAANGSAAPLPPLTRQNLGASAPLSLGQERLWSLLQLEPPSSRYNMYLAFRLEGALDVPALEHSLAMLFHRHEILRTSFSVENGEPRQNIQPLSAWQLPQFTVASEAEVPAFVQREIGTVFDLARGPLFRATLLNVNGAAPVLILVAHHLIADGWSWEVLLRELAEVYTSGVASLPALPVQYADYAAWQNALWQNGMLNGQLDYWRKHLSGAPTDLRWPFDFPETAPSTVGARQTLTLSPELSTAVRNLSRAAGHTLFTTLLTAYAALLRHYTGQTEFLLGAPVACRDQAETKSLIGYLNNVVLMRINTAADQTLKALSEQLRQTVLGAFTHADVPLHKILEQPEFQRLQVRRALFSVSEGLGSTLTLAGLKITPLPTYNATANFDVSLTVEAGAESWQVIVEYRTAIFRAETIAALLADFQTLLEAYVRKPNLVLSGLPLTRRLASIEAVSPAKRPYRAPRTPTELKLTAIWEELLGVQPIGVEDNFFELGGTSLLAVRAFSRLQTELNTQVPLTALLRQPTIAAIAQLVDAPQAEVWSPLVPIRTSGQRPPFFGIHAQGGHVLFWRDIVAHLPAEQPFYGLQAQGSDGLQTALTRIEEMAALYLSAIRTVQPHGPYFLGGYSMGGEIAFEMAQQLLAQDERVALLVLFDTSNPIRPVRNAPALAAQLENTIQPSRLQVLVRKLGGHLRRLLALSPSAQLQYLGRDARMRFRRLALAAQVKAHHRLRRRLPDDVLLKYLEESNLKAVLNYVPRPYAGPITLFRARASLATSPLEDPLGWKPLALGGLLVHLFDSPHQLVEARFAREVAEKLNQCLVSAQG